MSTSDHKELQQWNWGAFFLAPAWALANKLDWWGMLGFLPVVNIAVAFYLGYKGNRLAFPKSNYESVDDFMSVQAEWERWGFRFLGFIILMLYLRFVLGV